MCESVAIMGGFLFCYLFKMVVNATEGAKHSKVIRVGRSTTGINGSEILLLVNLIHCYKKSDNSG